MDNLEKRVLHLHDSAELTKSFTEDDIDEFARLTLDDNGMHTSAELSAEVCSGVRSCTAYSWEV